MAVSTIKIWNGSSFFDGPVRIWNGTAWTDCQHVRFWTGTAWVCAVNGCVPIAATITSSWATWNAAATGIVNKTFFATIASSWGPVTFAATGISSPRVLATVNSNWGTWNAAAAGTRGHPATIASDWSKFDIYGDGWRNSAVGNVTFFATITTRWGWTAEAHGNARPMPRLLESDVGRIYEDDTPRALEQREYFDDHGAWTPAALSGLVLDLDAGNYTNGATWANPGSGDDVPIYSTPLPVRVDGVVNGLPVVRFKTNEGRVRMYTNGVDDDFTLVYVGRMTPGGANWIGRIVNGIYSPNNILFGFWNGYQDVAYDNGFAAPNTQTAVTSDWKLYSADGVAGLDRFFGNGVLLGTIGTATGWGGTFAINGYDPTGAAETCECDIAKAYPWNRKLSDVERAQVEDYMRTRFALT